MHGRLAMYWSELDPPSSAVVVSLTDDQGVRRELDLDPAQLRQLQRADALRGGEVDVTLGAQVPAIPGPLPGRTAVPRFSVTSLVIRTPAPSRRGAASAQDAVAPTPFVTLLCKFADFPNEPWTPAQIGVTLGTSYPGAAHFFSELADGATPLAGSRAVGWFTLPHPRSYYVPQYSSDTWALAADCAAAADPVVDFNQYYGVNFQFNGPLNQRPTPPNDVLSYGGSAILTVEGAQRSYPVTWLSNIHAFTYVVIHHEMGHALGWPHSSGPYLETYDSRWDIMSAGYIYQDPVYGWLGPHTVAYHLAKSGWIAPGRLWQGGAGLHGSIIMERTALPPGNGYHAAILPLNDGTGRFYTVEVRKTAGYDRNLPGDGVLLHLVDPSLSDRQAQVVDVDGNGDPNDAGAYWRSGQIFQDVSHGLFVMVDSATSTGYGITLGVPSVAVTPAARRDSIAIDDVTTTADSTRIRLSPPDGTASWTVSHRSSATWISLETLAGTGDATLRWQRSASGLPIGTYVDTIAVTAAGMAGSPALVIDSLVVYQPPLALALSSTARRDSVLVGGITTHADSTRIILTGLGNASAKWGATHGSGAWFTLTATGGTGTGWVRWTRDPTGVAIGTYVDTITVIAPDALGSPAHSVDSLRVMPPLSVAAEISSHRDSLSQGSTAPAVASANILLAGYDHAIAPWTGTHGSASWLRITGGGTGSGVLRWEVDPTGQGPGIYVDTLIVTAVGATGSPVRIVDTLTVFEPTFAVNCAESVLMTGASCLELAEANYLDATGNHDGTYNLGDLLAYLDRKGLPLGSALLGAGARDSTTRRGGSSDPHTGSRP